MDIVEFAEEFYDVKLFEWQKEYLRKIDQLYNQVKDGDVDIRFVMMPKQVGRMYAYFKLKELIPDGSQNDCKH